MNNLFGVLKHFKLHLTLVSLLLFSILNGFSQRQLAEQYKNSGTEKAKKGDFDGALADFNKAISIDSTYEIAYNNRGNVWLGKNQYQSAIQDFKRAIRLKPTDPAFYINLGIAQTKMSDFQSAVQSYSSAIKLSPLTPEYYIKRALAYNNLQQYKSGIRDVDEAIRLLPEQAEYYYQRALIKLASNIDYSGHKDMAKAAELGHFKAKEIIVDVFFKGLEDDDILALQARSSMKIYLGDFKGALDDLNHLVKIDPKNGKAYSMRGSVKFKLEMNEDGCLDIKRALKLDDSEAKNLFEKNCREID